MLAAITDTPEKNCNSWNNLYTFIPVCKLLGFAVKLSKRWTWTEKKLSAFLSYTQPYLFCARNTSRKAHPRYNFDQLCFVFASDNWYRKRGTMPLGGRGPSRWRPSRYKSQLNWFLKCSCFSRESIIYRPKSLLCREIIAWDSGVLLVERVVVLLSPHSLKCAIQIWLWWVYQPATNGIKRFRYVMLPTVF